MAKAKVKQPTAQIKLVAVGKDKQEILVRIKLEGKKVVIATGSAWGNYKDKSKVYGSPTRLARRTTRQSRARRGRSIARTFYDEDAKERVMRPVQMLTESGTGCAACYRHPE